MKSDYELLSLVKENNLEALNTLHQKYYPLLYKKSIKYSKNYPFYFNDFLNEAELSFYKVVQNYEGDKGFIKYLNLCLDNTLLNYLKILNSKSNQIQNGAISLEEGYLPIKELENKKYNPEIIFFEVLDYYNLKNKILESLTWKEELIFILKEQNFSPKEISKITDNNLKTVYNIIKRVQEKIINVMSN